MKKIAYLCLITAVLFSCKKDNYDGPDAIIYGSILDVDTHDLVEQDIIQGAQIQYVEKGYTGVQYLVIKNDGTYRNSMMFSGDYTFTPILGNFHPVDSQQVHISGQTRVDFNVLPYLRIKNLHITKVGSVVSATFNVEQTDLNNVARIGLFVSPESAVGSVVNLKAQEIAIGGTIRSDSTITIDMDVSGTSFKTGGSYYFRAGALIDVASAKYNYAPAVIVRL